jgi:hypothetical protein
MGPVVKNSSSLPVNLGSYLEKIIRINSIVLWISIEIIILNARKSYTTAARIEALA